MDFAADAVLDVAAPPTRQPPMRENIAATAEGPTFEDHLGAATRESEAPSTETVTRPDQAPEETASSRSDDPADSLLGGGIAPVAPPQTAAEQTTSPVFVQVIAETSHAMQASEPQQQRAAPDGAAKPVAPTQHAAPTPTKAAADAQEASASARMDVPAAPVSKPDQAKAAAAPEKTAGQPGAPAPSAPSAPQPQTMPASPAPTVATTAASETRETPSTAAASVPAQASAELAARQPKAAPAQTDAKVDVSTADRAAPATTAPPRANAKAAVPQNAPKETAAFSSRLDASEAAQQQTSSAPAAAAASSTHTQHAATEQSAARGAPAAQQVAREIVRKFDGGNTRFELRLDPPEFGRVEVRLDVSRDHRVTAVIAADSPQALTELARHARDLEQMLQGAGLELSDSGLSFDLRQGSDRAATAGFGAAAADGGAPVEDTAPVVARPLGYERWRGVHVDVMV